MVIVNKQLNIPGTDFKLAFSSNKIVIVNSVNSFTTGDNILFYDSPYSKKLGRVTSTGETLNVLVHDSSEVKLHINQVIGISKGYILGLGYLYKLVTLPIFYVLILFMPSFFIAINEFQTTKIYLRKLFYKVYPYAKFKIINFARRHNIEW